MHHLLPLGRSGVIGGGAILPELGRPPIAPIMRPQLSTAHLPLCELLNAHALSRRHIAMVLVTNFKQPLPHRHAGDIQLRSESLLAARDFDGATQRRKVGGFHGAR